jgi:D-sedoheptulose 7-phosphate isomerase
LNRLDSIFDAAPDPRDFARGYLDYLSEILADIDADAVAAFVKTVVDARERDAQIFFIGNGGSAATASHFANDIAIGTRSPDKPFRAVSLTDNVAVMTAIANDDGYDLMFVQQLQTRMRPGDVVVAISASGNSPNVVAAIDYANANGAKTVSLTGFDGGKIAKSAAQNVHIPTNKGEYGPAEDGHMILDHLIGAYLIRLVRAEAAGAKS